jgi:hypothetical protein
MIERTAQIAKAKAITAAKNKAMSKMMERVWFSPNSSNPIEQTTEIF